MAAENPGPIEMTRFWEMSAYPGYPLSRLALFCVVSEYWLCVLRFAAC